MNEINDILTLKARKRRKKVHETIFLCILLGFPLLQVFIFYVVVNINSVFLAFERFEDGKYVFNGLNNFVAFFKDMATTPVLKSSFINSMVLYGVGLFVSMPLNILISYCLFKKLPLNGFFRAVIFLPSIIPGIVFVLLFRNLVESSLPSFFESLGLPFPNLLRSETLAFPMMIIYGLWTGFGVGIILYTNAMSRIPDSVLEYDRLEGVKGFRELWHVVIPMIFPTITTFLVTGVAGIFTNSGAVYAFYGESADSSVSTFGFYLFTRVIGSKATMADYPYAAAAGLVFTAIAAPLTLLVKHLLEKFGPSAEY